MKNKIKCDKCGKEMGNYSDHYCYSCYNKKYTFKELLPQIFLFAMVSIFFLFLILGLSGVLDPITSRLGINEDNLVSDYVKQYYPEFENCTIEYNSNLNSGCFGCVIEDGAKIYCSELDNRDSLKSMKGEPTATLKFERELDLKDIFELKLEEIGLK